MRIDPRSLTLVAMFLVSAAPLHADGLLLRTPEEGEYIVYDMLVVPIDEDEADQDQAMGEAHGTLRVACVGVEQADGATSRWIEMNVELAGGGNPDMHFVFKFLVPDDGVADEEAFLPFTRGWVRMGEDAEVTEIAPDPIPLFHPGFLFMRTVLASAEEPEETSSEKTLHINGEELVLSSAITGEFVPLNQEVEETITMMQTGEGTWWMHDEHAFALAADIIWNMQLGEGGDSKGIAIQLEAVETGDDAVSELPDSN